MDYSKIAMLKRDFVKECLELAYSRCLRRRFRMLN